MCTLACCWQLSALYTRSIVGRDEEDGRKLQAGIQIAIDKGVLEAQPAVRALVVGTEGGLSYWWWWWWQVGLPNGVYV